MTETTSDGLREAKISRNSRLPRKVLCHYWQIRMLCDRSHEKNHIWMPHTFHYCNLKDADTQILV